MGANTAKLLQAASIAEDTPPSSAGSQPPSIDASGHGFGPLSAIIGGLDLEALAATVNAGGGHIGG